MLNPQNKHNITEEMIPQIEEIVTDGELAKTVFEAAKSSIGQDLTEIDSVRCSLGFLIYLKSFFQAIYLWALQEDLRTIWI